MALSEQSTVQEWLEDPIGGYLVRDLLRHIGRDETFLAPVHATPIQYLVPLSQGQLPQSVVDDLVRAYEEHRLAG
ncbi:hypothetical protein [Microbacterium sp. GXS0129]|uniref:hypothetical protein n=1 Tax=Microbacterium sp. GXS0129 TaxID=3377836 RepID=UPI00383A4FE1